MNTETGMVNWVDTSASSTRGDYRRKMEEREIRNSEFFKQLGIDYAGFEVGDHVYLPLLQLFKRRK